MKCSRISPDSLVVKYYGSATNQLYRYQNFLVIKENKYKNPFLLLKNLARKQTMKKRQPNGHVIQTFLEKI